MSPRADAASSPALGPGAEFDLIRRMRERWGPLAVDIGDDAAVVAVPRGDQAVLSTDASLEGVHFRRDWLSLHEIAYRAVTAALSDLAAMAATPRGILVALQLPRDLAERILEIADGIADAARAADTRILGGNIARGDVLALTTTVLGSAHAPLRRGAARPGDLVYVTGALGGAAAALEAFRAGTPPAAGLRARFARPSARIAEARWLAARGAVAAIDISDGLAADAAHLAAASDVTVEIAVERVPVFAGATPEQALGGGEEYELLVAARAPLPADDFARAFPLGLTAVGRVLEGGGAVRLTRGGTRVAAPPGHDHFSR